MKIEDAETPVPVIDAARVEANLKKMQDYCTRYGLALRPHIKTHKLPRFARRQMELGAVGITCQKLGEAEVMVDAGCLDILISYPLIGAAKARRLAALAKRATMRAAIDNPVALETIAAAADEANAPIGVLVEFDSGRKRTGVVSVEEARELALKVAGKRNLRFDGLMTYPFTDQTAGFVAEAKRRLAADGLSVGTVSGGGTPNAWKAHEVDGLTELRVGTYIYHDRATVGAGAASLKECALHVHATVISRPTDDRAVIDAGSKTLSSDRVDPAVGEGFGLILDYPDAVIDRVNEEHGMLDLSRCGRKPEIGERVRIVPNHVCVVTNLHDEVLILEGGEVTSLPVAARGRTR